MESFEPLKLYTKKTPAEAGVKFLTIFTLVVFQDWLLLY
jgi:hypothetical protein